MTTPWVLSSRQCEIMVNNVVKQWETGDYAVHIAYTGVTTPPEGSDRLDSAPSISIAPSHSVKAVFSKVTNDLPQAASPHPVANFHLNIFLWHSICSNPSYTLMSLVSLYNASFPNQS